MKCLWPPFSAISAFHSMWKMGFLTGLPFMQTELEFFNRPVAGEMAPGVPMPTVPRMSRLDSISSTSDLIAFRVAG